MRRRKDISVLATLQPSSCCPVVQCGVQARGLKPAVCRIPMGERREVVMRTKVWSLRLKRLGTEKMDASAKNSGEAPADLPAVGMVH